MRVFAIGDIVGRPGREILKNLLRKLRQQLEIDLCIANGENAATGNGITCPIAQDLFEWGVDVITMGNHVWSKREIANLFERNARILRPANYPPGTVGNGHIVFNVKDQKVAVVNLAGRVYLEDLDCPFRTIDNHLQVIRKATNIIIVDFHAEATSEKLAMGWYLDGKVSAVFGTHTHVQTADERILPKGTGYITDIGMTGPYNSILGVQKEIIINRFITHLPERFKIAEGPSQINGIVLEIDEATGKTTAINRIIVNESP